MQIVTAYVGFAPKLVLSCCVVLWLRLAMSGFVQTVVLARLALCVVTNDGVQPVDDSQSLLLLKSSDAPIVHSAFSVKSIALLRLGTNVLLIG